MTSFVVPKLETPQVLPISLCLKKYIPKRSASLAKQTSTVICLLMLEQTFEYGAAKVMQRAHPWTVDPLGNMKMIESGLPECSERSATHNGYLASSEISRESEWSPEFIQI